MEEFDVEKVLEFIGGVFVVVLLAIAFWAMCVISWAWDAPEVV